MKKHNLTGVLVLLIFAVFMVSILLVLLSGADTVQRLTERDQRTYHQRTAVQYITTRIRQADRTGSICADNTRDPSTLILTELIDGNSYQTRVYCWDGYLRDMFCQAGAELPPEFGEEILPMNDFSVSCSNALVRAELTLPNGSKESLILSLRSEGGHSS